MALDVTGMSQDTEDERVLKLHFRAKVTGDDRRHILQAINLWIDKQSERPGAAIIEASRKLASR